MLSWSGKRLIHIGFPDVSNFFVLENGKPSVRCFVSVALWKKSSTAEWVTMGIFSRDAVQPLAGTSSSSFFSSTIRSSLIIVLFVFAREISVWVF